MSAVELRGLVVEYEIARTARSPRTTRRAVDEVSFTVETGESFGLVGESGCGKSTTANAIMGLAPITAGELRIHDAVVPTNRPVELARQVQMVFQDPASSLNPRRRVRSMLSELIRFHRLASASALEMRLVELMEMVGLPRTVLDSLPGDLSGGQRQRIAIARALAVEPRVLIADEAVSALDVSAQAKVINLLADLRDQLNLTLIFISHDLAVVRTLCDRAAVMSEGRIVEIGDTEQLFTAPREEFTARLVAAAPRLVTTR